MITALGGTAMGRMCHWVFWLYLLAAALSLLLVPAMRMGWFGLDPHPLAGIFALRLSQPWFSFAAELSPASIQTSWIAIAAVGLAINAVAIRAICGLLDRLRI